MTSSVLKGMIREMPTETIHKKLFTVDEFHRMGDVGILPENTRFELIRGEVIEMPTAQPPRAGRVNRLIRVFTSRLGESAIVGVQNPFPIDRYSEALPDVAVLKPIDDFYQTKHPGPDDVMLLVEVSHTTVSYDKNVKAPLYAEAGVMEYWQLDVKRGILIVRTEPADKEYRNVRIYRRGETITPQALPFTFSIDEILGPA
jgi:Uma2 family endonuclease